MGRLVQTVGVDPVKNEKQFIRCFLAIDIHDPLRALLETIQESIRKKLTTPLKWVEIGNIHLTIKFIRDMDVAHLVSIESDLRAKISTIPSFQLRPKKIGSFPNRRDPRVIWLGVNQPAELTRIAEIAERVYCEHGYPPELRKFAPHLTLARNRNSFMKEDVANLNRLVNELSWETNLEITVSRIKLYQSQLAPSGPKYSELFNIGLRNE